MNNERFISDRSYLLNSYTLSHSTLELRSIKVKDSIKTNIEIVFSNTRFIQIGTDFLDEIEINIIDVNKIDTYHIDRKV
jgi:hypothetical protein